MADMGNAVDVIRKLSSGSEDSTSSSSSSETDGPADEEVVKIDAGTSSEESTCSMLTSENRRSALRRASKDKFNSGMVRRIPMKAKERNASTILKPSEIKKIYLKQKLSRFRPTSLETIFEEPKGNGSAFSVRKLRRSLNLSDGTIDQQKRKQRRAKIRKEFGRKSSSKSKMSLDDFKKIFDRDDENETDGKWISENGSPLAMSAMGNMMTEPEVEASMDVEVGVEENITKMNNLVIPNDQE